MKSKFDQEYQSKKRIKLLKELKILRLTETSMSKKEYF